MTSHNSEDWIRAIQSVAEKLQVLDESEVSDMQLGDDAKSMKKRKVVRKSNKLSHFIQNKIGRIEQTMLPALVGCLVCNTWLTWI